MKRIISMLACAAVVICSCQKDPQPELSFESGNYVMGADEALTVKIVSSKAPAADLTIDFAATGSAAKGSDYELSAESFIMRAGETSAEITITPKNNLGNSLNINLALTLPAGYIAGDFGSAVIALGTKEKVAYSFAKREAKLIGEVEVTLNLIGETSGADFVAGGEYTLPFVIESSAVAGTDYEVKGGAKAFVVAKGEKSASITLKSLVENPEGVKELVIKLDETAIAAAYGERFSSGVIASTKAVITKGLIFSDLEGKWAYASTPILDDPEADLMTFGALVMDAADGEFNADWTAFTVFGFPTGTSADILEFKYNNNEFTIVPKGSGSVLNYFKEGKVNSIVPTKYTWYNYYPSRELDANILSLEKADIKYSANEDDIKPAEVIVNLSEDGKTLDLFITTKNYVPTDFFKNSYMALSEMWTMEGMESFVGVYDLYFTFKKVTE